MFVKKQFVVNITIEGEGGGTVDEEVVTGLKVDDKYEYGTELKLTAKPSAEWKFSSWKEDLEGTDNPQTITIDTTKTITAVFIKNGYPLTVEVEGQGSVAEKVIKAGLATDYNSGTIVELTATAETGWEFKEWTGDLTGTDNPSQITIDAAKTVKAVFVKKPAAYLDENGVTIKANSWAEVGDNVEIGGVTYTLVDETTLRQMVADDEDVTKVVTTKVTNMSQLFKDKSTFNQNISSWDTSNVTNMRRMFWTADNFNQNIRLWDVSKVTNMEGMFTSADNFNKDIGDWNVSNVTNMDGTFRLAISFNQDISNWNVSSVIDMNLMFYKADSFNQDIGNWDVSNVINMSYMLGCKSFNQDISNWNVSNVTDMQGMFRGANAFNQDIGNWNVSNVTIMRELFYDAILFNQDLSNWDVSNVTHMTNLFFNADAFNTSIGNWDVSNVINMEFMFGNTDIFNQNIGSWDVSNLVKATGMFINADGFNQDIGSWDVSNISEMDNMFNLADIFNQDLSKWCVSAISSEPTGFSNTALTDANKPKWGKCPIDTSKVTVTLNSTSISSSTVNGVTTARYGIGTQINNNWKNSIEVLKTEIFLPNGTSASSEDVKGVLGSGLARGITWNFNNSESATITWTYKYEDVEYDVSYSWELENGSAREEVDGDNSKLGITSSNY